MKQFLLMIFILFSGHSFAKKCTEYKSLVFGGVVQTSKIGERCFVEVDVDEIAENPQCPLARVDIELSVVEDSTCQLKLGDGVDGIIVQSTSKKYLYFSN